MTVLSALASMSGTVVGGEDRELQGHVTELDEIAVAENGCAGFAAVHIDPVQRFQVPDDVAAVELVLDLRVKTRDGGVGHHQLVVSVAADPEGLAGYWMTGVQLVLHFQVGEGAGVELQGIRPAPARLCLSLCGRLTNQPMSAPASSIAAPIPSHSRLRLNQP